MLSALDDQQLMDCVKKDDQKAFGILFDRYNALLINHIFQRLRDVGEAEDAVQDIFVSLWERRAQIESENIAGYLFTAARNKVLNMIRHREVVTQYEADYRRFTDAHPVNSTQHLIEKKDTEAILNAEIDKLSPRMRQVFLLSRQQYLTHQEIADRLGITKFTVNDHIKASLRILRTKVELVVALVLWSIAAYF